MVASLQGIETVMRCAFGKRLYLPYRRGMNVIKTFKDKQLEALWYTGKSRIDARLHRRIRRRLDYLDQAAVPGFLNLPGFNFHGLRGYSPKRYTIHVNGPWCITFEFHDGDAYAVDLVQYH